jgi:hypothetical protein
LYIICFLIAAITIIAALIKKLKMKKQNGLL